MERRLRVPSYHHQTECGNADFLRKVSLRNAQRRLLLCRLHQQPQQGNPLCAYSAAVALHPYDDGLRLPSDFGEDVREPHVPSERSSA